MQKNVMKEDAKITRNRELNNKILDLELERHTLAMQIRKLQKQIEQEW